MSKAKKILLCMLVCLLMIQLYCLVWGCIVVANGNNAGWGYFLGSFIAYAVGRIIRDIGESIC